MVPDRTDFGYELMIQRKNHRVQDMVHMKQFPPASAANGSVSGLLIVVGSLADSTAGGNYIGQRLKE